MSIINIPKSKIKISKKYSKLNLEENKELKNAIFSMSYDAASKRQKNKVYNKDKALLKRKYWILEKYIKILWQNPAIDKFSCYDAYFLNDNWSNEDKNYQSIVSDIEIIIWKIEELNQKEINKLICWKVEKNYWKILNPIYWFWIFIRLLWRHKIISLIIFVTWIVITAIVTESIKPLTDKISKPVQNYLSGKINQNSLNWNHK